MKTKNNVPQRRPNKSMNGQQLLQKAMTNLHRPKTESERKNEEVTKILKK